MDLKNEIRAKLSNRKDNGWRDFVKENGPAQVKEAFTQLVVSSLKEGREPISKEVLKSLIFNNADIAEIDILMRLK